MSAAVTSAPPPEPLSAEEFRKEADVSRETFERLETYADLLVQWQGALNLVGPKTLDDLWRRHMLDSAQLFPLVPRGVGPLFDLGSGAGFPGLVLAIMGIRNVHLVESDQRKAEFLRTVARATDAKVQIHVARAESLGRGPFHQQAGTVTARALAPLTKLLGYAAPLLKGRGVALFPKGARVEEELTEARRHWKMQVMRFPSRTDPSGTILKIMGIRRAGR